MSQPPAFEEPRNRASAGSTVFLESEHRAVAVQAEVHLISKTPIFDHRHSC